MFSANVKSKHSVAIGFTALGLLFATPAFAHCDTLDGPVVSDARIALQKKQITPVLKWIKPEYERELKDAFHRSLAVRSQGQEARELADQFFFETLVRLHREGEGAPYTGLKPADSKLDPAVVAADEALENGKADTLVENLTADIASSVRKRFQDALEKRRHSEHNVSAGRDYVAAYVEFVHYVESLHNTALQESSDRSTAKHSH